MTKKTPHDQYFKVRLKNLTVARDFLRAFLPTQVQAKIDLNTLRLEEGTYIDAALQSQYSDLVFSVAAEEDDAAYVYVMLEHQSTPDPDMVFRTLGYMMRIMIDRTRNTSIKKYPLVFPVIFYNGIQTLYPHPTAWESAFSHSKLLFELLNKGMCLVDINQVPDE